MAKKKASRTRSPKIERTAPSAATFSALDMDQAMAGLHKLLAGKEFASIDEANAFLQQTLQAHGGRLPEFKPETPLEMAQDLVAQAYNQTDPILQRRLARQALTLTPDCADAYVLLAQYESDTLKQLTLFEQAEAAGRRVLGEAFFEREVGHFWGIVETRPYMRARAGVARWAWMLGDRNRAIAIYTDLLRLNPNDNQGVRYLLASALLEDRTASSQQALERLLAVEAFGQDRSAGWVYSRALLYFQQGGGPADQANVALRDALQVNPHVPALLLDEQAMPEQASPFVGVGDPSEAADYVSGAYTAWQQTSGALLWLREQRPRRRPRA